MSNLDLQFEEFLKESLSTDESPDTNSNSKHERNVKETLPEPRKFWWMKERPRLDKTPTEAASHRSSFSGASVDSSKVEGDYSTPSPTMKNVNVAKGLNSASPDITSSMAEFLEKEKLCKELSSSISEVDSPGMDLEYTGDDVTDDDIGSIMEQLSQLAGSGDDSAADKSVEEILKEAEDLVRETSHSFAGLSDSSDLLKTPLPPDLVIRGRSGDLLPASRKTDNKYFSIVETGRDNKTGSTKAATVNKTSRKTDNKSPSRERIKKNEKVSGIRPGSSSKTSRKAPSKPQVTEEPSEDELSDFKLDTPLDPNQTFGGRTFDYVDVEEGARSVTKSVNRAGELANSYLDSINKVKDSTKKEKTVTFEEGLPIYPNLTDGVDKRRKDRIVQISSQTLMVENVPERKLDKHYHKDDELSLLDRITQESSGVEELVSEDVKRGSQHTKILSVSPPLIQHGDMVGTPEAIFQLIDDEVRSEIVAALQESSRSCRQQSDDSPMNIAKEMEKIFGESGDASSVMLDGTGLSFPRKPLSVVLEESSVSEASIEVNKPRDAVTMTEQLHFIGSSNKSVQVTDSLTTDQVISLERELLGEQNKSLRLKAKLETEEQDYRKQLDALKCKHEEEMFSLKKDVYVLNAKIADFEKQESSSVEKGGGDCHVDDAAVREHRLALLETELQQQEQLMLGYQRENVKLCQDMKQLKVCLTLIIASYFICLITGHVRL